MCSIKNKKFLTVLSLLTGALGAGRCRRMSVLQGPFAGFCLKRTQNKPRYVYRNLQRSVHTSVLFFVVLGGPSTTRRADVRQPESKEK